MTMTTKAKRVEPVKPVKPARPAKPVEPAKSAKTLTVTMMRSAIDHKQALALQGLGLRRIRHTVQVVDTASSRGLILKVRHLVTVGE
jgi:large subunit ribosomal protein L30